MPTLAALALLLSATTTPAGGGPAPQRVLVMELRADGVDGVVVRTLQSSLTTELGRVPGLEVLSSDDIKNLAGLEADRQQAGCDDENSCLAEVADALGARAAVFGSVGRLGSLTVVNLSLLDTTTATPVGRAELKVEALEQAPAALLEAVPTLVASLLGEPARLAYTRDVDERRAAVAKAAAASAAATARAAAESAAAANAAGAGTIDLKENAGPPIYVVAPKVVGMSESVGTTVASTLARVAGEEGLAVFTRDDAAAILSQSTDLQLLGADADGPSLSELGRRVGTRHVMACVVSTIDGDTVVQARLIDVEKAAVVSLRETRASQFGGGFLATVEAAGRLVIAPIFADQKGSIALKVTEEGADVVVDDQVVGTTPLIRPLSLTGGHHLVEVRKKGFIRFAETVKVSRGSALVREVVLRPSKDFLDEYRSVNGTLRALAWTSTGLAIAGGVAGAGLWFGYAGSLDGPVAVDDKFRDPTTGRVLPENADAYRAERAEAEFTTTALYNGAAAASAVAGLVGVAAATFLIVGDDPARYDALE